MPRITLATAALLAVAALPTHGQPPHQRFMGGPVTLEDQGSFFVGGVTKISEYATVPGAPPGQPAAAANAAADHDRADVRAVPDPCSGCRPRAGP